GVHGGTYAVDIAPWAQRVAIGVLLGRSKAGGITGRQPGLNFRKRLPGRAKIQQYRRTVEPDIDIGGLDVQMQQLLGMDFAQAIEQFTENAQHEIFRNRLGLAQDVVLQRFAALIVHDHVDGIVGAEEIQHAYDVLVIDVGE